MIQKLMNSPLLLNPQFLGIVSNIDWLPMDSEQDLSYDTYNNVAIIPIHGLLTKRRELFSSIFGTTSYEEIFEAMSFALADEKIDKILLDIDSPGGEAGGLFDLVDFIYNARIQKPIYAFANDHAFSAAYAIASACSKIFVNRVSGVGSIGVIATHVDISEADKKAGLKYTTIYAGEKKNDLSPHEPLTENAVSDLQIEVNRLYEIFIETVARNRNTISETVRSTEAGIYFGRGAIVAGLADELIDFRICLSIITGGNMQEDIETQEAKLQESTEKYKAEVLEITKLCKLAKAENKIADFIEHGLSAEQVKEKLLASVSNSQHEIVSAIYHKKAEQENPVVAAAKARQHDVASKDSLR